MENIFLWVQGVKIEVLTYYFKPENSCDSSVTYTGAPTHSYTHTNTPHPSASRLHSKVNVYRLLCWLTTSHRSASQGHRCCCLTASLFPTPALHTQKHVHTQRHLIDSPCILFTFILRLHHLRLPVWCVFLPSSLPLAVASCGIPYYHRPCAWVICRVGRMSDSAWSQRAVQRHSHIVHLSLMCELQPSHWVHSSYPWEFCDTNMSSSVQKTTTAKMHQTGIKYGYIAHDFFSLHTRTSLLDVSCKSGHQETESAALSDFLCWQPCLALFPCRDVLPSHDMMTYGKIWKTDALQNPLLISLQVFTRLTGLTLEIT